PSGKVMLNGSGEIARYFRMSFTGAASIQASTTSAPSTAAAAFSPTVGTSQGTPGTVGSQSNTPEPKIQLCRGRTIAFPVGRMTVDFPVGMRQWRSAELPKVPARDRTGRLLLPPQNSPVVSATGFWASGMDRAHCPQAADHSP